MLLVTFLPAEPQGPKPQAPGPKPQAPGPKPRFAAVAALVAVVATGCRTTPAQIEVVRLSPATTVSAGRLGEYESALSAILKGFDEAMGLPRPEAALVLFPTRRSFEQGLLKLGYPPALARSASTFNAIGGARAVLVNAGIVNGFDRSRRVRLIAHELVHTLQYQFSGGTRGASEQWLREGFAEWVACRITAHLGFASFGSLRGDLLGLLADVRIGVPAAPFSALATFPQWVEAQGRYEAPLYVQAFIAAELLIEMRDVATVVRYFERFKDSTETDRVFVEVFGLERAAFERAFTRRWREIVAQYGSRG